MSTSSLWRMLVPLLSVAACQNFGVLGESSVESTGQQGSRDDGEPANDAGGDPATDVTDDVPDNATDDVTDPEPWVDPTIALFDPEVIQEVAITLEPADWEELRKQKRQWENSDEDGCHPSPSPFTYFPASVVINGEEVFNVGVSKKCFLGSCDESKPSLKVKFNEYVSGQRFATLRRMTLNNCKQDKSYIRQCLSYQLFAAAGVPAPRCNFSRLSANGEDLGLYVNVEALKKEFLRRHFASDDGNMYEASLSDFRPGWVDTLDRKTNEHPDDWRLDDRSDLDAIVAALELPDEELLATVESLVDLDEFLSFWVIEAMIGQWDGYSGNANNTYIYNDPTTGTWSFIPWGPDLTFGGYRSKVPELPSLYANGLLSWRLYQLPAGRLRYVERANELLAGVWAEEAILAEIDRMEALILPVLDPTGSNGSSFQQEVEDVRIWLRGRAAILAEELQGDGPDWMHDPLRPYCQ